MSPKLARSMVVDLKTLQNKEFSESILESYNSLFDTWVDTEPQLFGDELLEGLEFVGFELQDLSNNSTFRQKHRAAGLSDKYKELRQNIDENGWKVKYPPPAIIRCGPDDKEITGNTRMEALTTLGVKNCPVAVYRFVGNPTTTEQESILIRGGQIFQPPHDPSSPPKKEDIAKALKRLCAIGECDPNDISALMNSCDELCERLNFTKKTRSEIVFSIHNTYNPDATIVSWAAGRNNNTEKVMRNQFKFVDTDKVIYMIAASSSWDKVYGTALRLWADNPTKQIRLVVHTSTLDGFDLQECYESRIAKWYAGFMELLKTGTSLCNGNLDNAKSRILPYAVMPAISDIHDIEEPLFFNHKTKEVYQKKTGYTLSLI